jgi:hypothetical protein
MKPSIKFIQVVGLFSLLAVVGCPPPNPPPAPNPHITVTKLPDETGGRYSISGTGFAGSDQQVRLEIQNAPLKRPDTWQLGTAPAQGGNFSFQTEDFRCNRVDDQQKRDQLKSQQVTFVATGATSHYSASAVATANEIFICP